MVSDHLDLRSSHTGSKLFLGVFISVSDRRVVLNTENVKHNRELGKSFVAHLAQRKSC